MNHMPKVLATIAAVSMLVPLAACGAKPGQGTTQATGANVTTWAMTDAPWDPIKECPHLLPQLGRIPTYRLRELWCGVRSDQ